MSLVNDKTIPRLMEQNAHVNPNWAEGRGDTQFNLSCPNPHCGHMNTLRTTHPPRGIFGGRCHTCNTLLEG